MSISILQSAFETNKDDFADNLYDCEMYMDHEDDLIQHQRDEAPSEISDDDIDISRYLYHRRLIPSLPASSKTLLMTCSAEYNIIEMLSSEGASPGEFVYLSIAKGLQNCVKPAVHINRTIWLQINTDGIPLSSSDTTVLWPFWEKYIFIQIFMSLFPLPFIVENLNQEVFHNIWNSSSKKLTCYKLTV